MKTLIMVGNSSLRIKFLDNCKWADLIRHFVKLRIVNNGYLCEKYVHALQKQLMNKELLRAKGYSKNIPLQLDKEQDILRNTAQ